MFARLALAAMLIATVPMVAATNAEAAQRDGKFERSGKKGDWTATKSYSDRTGKRDNSKVVVEYKSKSKPAYSKYSHYDDSAHHRKGKWHHHGKSYGWKYFTHGYAPKGKRAYSCQAVAKKRGGYGSRLWGIGGKAYGHGACDRAMYECRRELGHRKSTGRNPFAKCVIVHRG